MQRYSFLNILGKSLGYHKGWQRAWRDPEPKPAYDVIIIGGGGHGLATAYYLAKEHGITNVAILEKGWIGGGNTGRNTTVVRSNYLWDDSSAIYEHSMKLWEGLTQELNYNLMFSQRGLCFLAHSEHEMQEIQRRGNAIHLNGIENEFLTPGQVKEMIPEINIDCRYPVMGALLQKRAGTARHDAVAWGYARAADSLGVDIIQNCEVTGFDIQGGRVMGVKTTRGDIRSNRVGVVAAGHTSVVMQKAGVEMPLESVPLQALVSEPIKPVIDCVLMSNGIHVYVSQSDKGELVVGAGTDPQNSYSQRGGLDAVDHVIGPLIELMPIFSRLRMMRQWAGIVDISPDRSPIISHTEVDGLYVNSGWGTGGFKATPGSGNVFAASLAQDALHTIAKPFSLDRFTSGRLVDEAAAAAAAH
ncbi:sarcosine oxidase subunit beta [Leisingera sp. ANG-M1]|uniref:sarcosine oxidase subunit beta family protein n=1 Tax=Leisingera sp. ANG-M1 TaxID=1577895 RepID=UPI00057F2293|nr:sarcosine oxidase subunit beta family protein [Leisingera sp. ANG-M1]KIC11637.1 sarcosine oxidase subunit beta [Leisingera sp. ANG-M1]